MIVSERALRALDSSDVTLPPDLAAHYHTAVSHRQQGGPRDAQLRPRPGRDVLINRGALASSLVRACQERFPDAVAFRFGWELVALDAAGGSARFGPAEGTAGTADGPGGEPLEVGFDLLVGADGARSATRALLQQQDPDFQVGLVLGLVGPVLRWCGGTAAAAACGGGAAARAGGGAAAATAVLVIIAAIVVLVNTAATAVLVATAATAALAAAAPSVPVVRSRAI